MTVEYAYDAETFVWKHPLAGVTRKGDGYGSKIHTNMGAKWRGKKYRVYAACWSNVPSLYILVGRKKVFIL